MLLLSTRSRVRLQNFHLKWSQY